MNTGGDKMDVIKNGMRLKYDRSKIRNAIIQAYNQITYPDFDEVDVAVDEIEDLIWNCAGKQDFIEIDKVENLVMSVLYRELPQVAREYSSYKIKKEQAIKNPTEIEKVLFVSPEIALENGNKDANFTHIKNAYLAEIPSKEFMREMLPKECLAAHDKGAVYFHDMAYSGRPMSNCCLLNLEELFKGCKINGVWIEEPKSFRTACTVATQVLTHATNMQYGLR